MKSRTISLNDFVFSEDSVRLIVDSTGETSGNDYRDGDTCARDDAESGASANLSDGLRELNFD